MIKKEGNSPPFFMYDVNIYFIRYPYIYIEKLF